VHIFSLIFCFFIHHTLTPINYMGSCSQVPRPQFSLGPIGFGSILLTLIQGQRDNAAVMAA
jgi:hypothetical protein